MPLNLRMQAKDVSDDVMFSASSGGVFNEKLRFFETVASFVHDSPDILDFGKSMVPWAMQRRLLLVDSAVAEMEILPISTRASLQRRVKANASTTIGSQKRLSPNNESSGEGERPSKSLPPEIS